MKRNRIFISFIIGTLLIGLIGCQRVLYLAYGIKKPKTKTEKQVVKAIHKYELQEYLNCSITQRGFMLKNRYDGDVNTVFIFNKEGHLLTARDSSNCNGDVNGFLRNFENPIHSQIVDSFVMDSVLPELRGLDGSSFEEPILGHEYTAMVFWASFVGRLNHMYTKEWDEILCARTDVDLKVINVNCDIRAFWPGFDHIKGVEIDK